MDQLSLKCLSAAASHLEKPSFSKRRSQYWIPLIACQMWLARPHLCVRRVRSSHLALRFNWYGLAAERPQERPRIGGEKAMQTAALQVTLLAQPRVFLPPAIRDAIRNVMESPTVPSRPVCLRQDRNCSSGLRRKKDCRVSSAMRASVSCFQNVARTCGRCEPVG